MFSVIAGVHQNIKYKPGWMRSKKKELTTSFKRITWEGIIQKPLYTIH